MAPGHRFRVPGVEAAQGGEAASSVDVDRVGENRWAICTLTDAEMRFAALGASKEPRSPAEVLGEIRPPSTAGGCLLHLEHDLCGAWVTLANAGGPRPVVVRRAGWIDLRGHKEPADDRVGLGPGDALVLVTSDSVSGDDGWLTAALPEALLTHAGGEAEELAGAARRAAGSAPRVNILVMRVPADLGPDPAQRVVEATGTPAEDLVLPGYPLGDQQPDLWRRPPSPPRDARMRLPPEAQHVRQVRSLLDRLLASWRIDQLVEEGDVSLLATELAANAVMHARTTATVMVRYLGDRLQVAVADASPTLPQLRKPSPDLPGGRGLILVDALASTWGVDIIKGGKRVWFELPVGSGSPV